MSAVLDGVRVLEVADWGFVPSYATVPGDWGADWERIAALKEAGGVT